jgi:hypothetical protein
MKYGFLKPSGAFPSYFTFGIFVLMSAENAETAFMCATSHAAKL